MMCGRQYNFPKQESVVQFVIDAIQAEAFNPKTLFLIGTYTIGEYSGPERAPSTIYACNLRSFVH